MYYIATIKFEIVDDRTDRIKIRKEQYLVNAIDISNAEQKIKEKFKHSIADFLVSGIQETNIIGIIQ
jgi:hypothetical protein